MEYQKLQRRRRKLGRSTLLKSLQRPVQEDDKSDVMPFPDRPAVNVEKIRKKQAIP